MKTEIPELRKVQYYYTDLLFLLAEGHKPNIFLLNICFPMYIISQIFGIIFLITVISNFHVLFRVTKINITDIDNNFIHIYIFFYERIF